MVYRDCHWCDFRTNKSSTMSMHVSMKHKKHKTHECPICHELFVAKTQLQHHFVNNHCEADIPCLFKGCTKKFKNETTHKIHYTRVHMKHTIKFRHDFSIGYVRCQYCEHVCKPAGMYYHTAICSPQSPFSPNYCKECVSDEQKNIDSDYPEIEPAYSKNNMILNELDNMIVDINTSCPVNDEDFYFF